MNCFFSGLPRCRNSPALGQRTSSLEMGKARTPQDHPRSGGGIQVSVASAIDDFHICSRRLDASNVQTQSTDDQTQYDEGDPRGGFSHKMMEQFESLHNQGYTVLLGESASDEKKKQSSAESSPPSTAIDYSKFDNVEDPSDDEAEEDVDELDDADARIKRLGEQNSILCVT